jgi:hypothetical protein
MKKTLLLSCALLAAAITGGAPLTRAGLDRMLEETAANPSCILFLGNRISPAPRGSLFFYRCPHCHTLTPHWCNIYDNQYLWADEIISALPALQKSGLCVELDRHEFCRTCCPDANARMARAYWLIRIDGELRKVPIKKYDLSLLQAFLDREPLFDTGGIVESVAYNLPRLHELLDGDTGKSENSSE